MVVTIGRLAVGGEQTAQVTVQLSSNLDQYGQLSSVAAIHSATALPIFSNGLTSKVDHDD